MPDPQINDLFSLSAVFSLKYRKGSRLCRFTVSSLTKYLLHKLFVQLSIVDDKVYPFMTRVYPSSVVCFQQDYVPCHNHLKLVS